MNVVNFVMCARNGDFFCKIGGYVTKLLVASQSCEGSSVKHDSRAVVVYSHWVFSCHARSKEFGKDAGKSSCKVLGSISTTGK